ncbi:Calcium-dependent protein kinase 2 (OsCDPK2) (OsCPK2) [Durusdinium trenchii]|uniref:Calmodulin n=1 Tax=Durusdinium trenchii TaxID=1381693 RepID=A0ABP0KPT7_9DINO
MAPSEAKFDFLTFVGILVPKVRQRLTELQSTKIMRYFCNFDREGTGVVSVYKCIEIARCLRMDQLHMIDALKEQGFEEEPGVLVDFDSFERAVMSCRERTNRQLREREIDILTEMKVRPDLFEQCRDNIAQVYEIFRKFSGDAGSIGVVTANDAFLSVYELGMMPREGWQRDNIKSLLVPEDAEDIVYMQTELNFEEFLEFLRCVREYNDEQRLEELMERFQRLDKDRNGVLDMKELHALLEEAQCCPRTRKEQEEVQQLIQSVDADGNNVIDFDEFKELVQRIDEKFASLRLLFAFQSVCFEFGGTNSIQTHQRVLAEHGRYALARGFTETELGSFRAIFEHLDADNSGQLDMAEVRQCLSIMQHNSTWQAFEQTWILLDKDASGTLEFEEFIDFMRLMRDGEGVFAMDNGQKLPSHVKKLDERTLRSVLGHYGLSKSYLWALDKVP